AGGLASLFQESQRLDVQPALRLLIVVAAEAPAHQDRCHMLLEAHGLRRLVGRDGKQRKSRAQARENPGPSTGSAPREYDRARLRLYRRSASVLPSSTLCDSA